MTKIDPEYYFILADGKPVKNLLELADSFEDMTNEVFFTHVNNSKNDFSRWVREVLEENKLADRLESTNSRLKHQVYILRHLATKKR